MPISAKTPPRLRSLAAPLAALVRSALAGEGRSAGDIGIVLTGDPEIRALNHRWRGLDRATDVLSFGYDDPPGPRVHGDLVVSMDRVAEQAARFRVTPGRELARLVIHGALHLRGLDHRTATERRDMRAHEARLLRAAAAEIRTLDRVLTVAAGTQRSVVRRTRARRTVPRRGTRRTKV
jgi:probable rRNA maturation factor